MRPRKQSAPRPGNRVIGYIRVSTDEQARSGLGLEAQRAQLLAECARRGWDLIEVIADEGVSGKSLDRPGMIRALEILGSGGADLLLAAKLDRVSRSVLDVCLLGERAAREGWNLCLLDAAIDTTSPHGRAQLSMMATFAQLERELIGQRTREALTAARSRGQRLGAPVRLDAALAERIRREVAAGSSANAVARRLNDEGVPGATGGRWHAQSVLRVVERV